MSVIQLKCPECGAVEAYEVVAGIQCDSCGKELKLDFLNVRKKAMLITFGICVALLTALFFWISLPITNPIISLKFGIGGIIAVAILSYRAISRSLLPNSINK